METFGEIIFAIGFIAWVAATIVYFINAYKATHTIHFGELCYYSEKMRSWLTIMLISCVAVIAGYLICSR